MALAAETGEDFGRAEATERCKISKMVALRLARGRSKLLVNNKGVECWHGGAAVKYNGNTTNPAADLAEWRKGMKMEIELLTKSWTAKQASLGDVGIQVVPHRKIH